ncbi:YSIRK signal domain/LPXTG anchor domain surface protein [Lactobacillus psittaci]|uniref:YSIRK signal domain/LPXTG anchor domain surface protein n=1 Tax=Lactobacillus psittaci TaxID=116089 RepID=UPI0003FF81F0|nr:YSIRK signal domain/LPXTG anchor domain surface protein [Lactobacillus psittaci]
MLSKNNKKQYALKHANGKQHFALRKTTLGLASVLLSTTLYLGGYSAQEVHAADTDTTVNNGETTQSQVDKSELETAYNNALNVQKSDVKYTNETDATEKSAYDSAVSTAKTVLDNSAATSEDVSQAITNLETAYNALTGTAVENTNNSSQDATAQTSNVSSNENNSNTSSNALTTSDEDRASNDAVQAAQTELDKAAAALNGQVKLDTAKQSALSDFDTNYPHLNNAQKATAKKRITDSATPDELKKALETNSQLEFNMAQMADKTVYNETIRTNNYTNADPDKKQAFDDIVSQMDTITAAEGPDWDIDQTGALNNKFNDVTHNLNGDIRMLAKQALQKAHDDGEAGKNSDYKYYNASSQNLRDAYDQALTDAAAALADPVTTYQQYLDARKAIQTAYSKLDGKQTDKTDLQAKVSDADTVRQSADYKNASDQARHDYENAIKAGQAVLDNDNATQEAVNTARDNIDKAKQALTTSANAAQSKVNSDVKATPVGDKTNLTSEEQADIKKNVEDANKDNDVKSVTVDPKSGAATVEFSDGSKATIPASKTTTDTDKTRLKSDLDDSKTDATKAIHDKASTATKEAYDKAVSDGQGVFSNDKASQKDIDEAATAIETTKKAMEDSANAAQSKVNTSIEKTAVGNKDALTSDEQADVKDAVEKANPNTTVSVDDKGTATVEFSDGSKATIAPEYTVKGTDKTELVKELSNDHAVKNTETVTLPDSEDKTPIQIYQRASDEARQKYDDAISKGNEVNDNKTATQDEIDTATKAIQAAVKELTSSATHARLKFDFSFDKTPVVDPTNVSEDEKQTILNNVAAKNDNVDKTKSTVNADGSATIVLKDGSSVTLTPAQTIKDVNKDELRQDITTADNLKADTTNYNKASDAAREKFEKALSDAVSARDNQVSQKTVDDADKALKEAISDLQSSINSATANNPSVKTPVGRGRDVNEDESAAIKSAVEAANPGTTVEVNKDGSATVTLANGGKVTIPASATTQDTNKTALKTALDNGNAAINSNDFNNASTESQKALRDAVEAGQKVFDNPASSQKQIDDAASAINTALDKVTKSINAAKGKVITDITKTPVGDKTNLTDDEKKQVAENVKKAVETKTPSEKVTVDVNADGSATVTFNDGSKATVPATDTVTDTDKTKLKAAIDEESTVENGSDFKNASTEAQNNYKKAIEAGKGVYANDKAPQKKIDDATDVINNAKAALADSAKSAADKLDVNVVKTQVGNKAALTDTEKQSVKDNVTDAIKTKTPDAEFTISVDDTGNATVTFNDGSKGVISSDKTVTDVDKTDLQKDVDEKSSVEKTPAYYNASDVAQKAYDKAIEDGQSVLDNPTATKDDVDKARAAIAEAKQALTGKDTDKSDLESSIDLAKDFKDAGDTYNNASDDQRQAFDKALAEANKQDQDPNATQADVDNAQKALDEALTAISGDNDASKAHNPAKTPVPAAHKNALTSQEEAAIEQAIKDANPDKVKSVLVDPLTAEASVVFNDGSKKTYTASETIKDVDKSELQTQNDIADVAKDTSSYFNASDDKKTAFDKALAEAQAILSGNKKDTASQTDVDNAKSALEQAIANLDGKATNKKPLEESIELAKDLQKTDVYNNASDSQREILKEALQEAQAQDADASATQENVNAAKAKLDEALENFTGATDAANIKKPAKTPVPAAHKTALTEDEISAVKSAITSANSNVKNVEVDAQGNASIFFNDGSKASLNASDTITDVDKSALQTAKEAAQGLKDSSSYYNASSAKKQAFNEALAKAESILNGQEKDTSTQAEIDDATQKLNDACRALDGKATDKTGLEDSIAVADATKDLDTYDMASDKQKSDLENALTNAKSVDADENASQESVDNAKKALDAALEAIDNIKARDTKAPETKTEIHNPDSFSKAEQQEIHDQVQQANTGATDIKVDDQGNATVTYDDGSQKVIPGKDTVKDTAMVDPLINTGEADAELNSFNKTPVQDPDKLTDSEKTQVVSNIKSANSDKNIADVEVKDNGRTIITFEDGTQKEIDRSQTISYPEYSMGDALTTADEGNSAQAEQSLNNFDKVAVQDPDALTNTEKQQVISNIKNANSDKHIADVEVKDNGRTIVTFEDGTQKELSQAQTITFPDHSMGEALTTTEDNPAQAEQSLNSFDKVPVQNLEHLTDVEKAQVISNIKTANSDKHIANVEVKDNGRTIVTFEDGTQKELTPDQTIVQKPAEVVTTPETPVKEEVDKAALQAEVKKQDQVRASTAYTNASEAGKKAYDDALAQAEKVLADSNATQAQIDEALANLKAATAKLDGKDSAPTSTTKSNNSSTETTKTQKVNVAGRNKDKQVAHNKLGTNADRLPQTGSNESEASVIGFGIAALALALLGFKKRKDEK